MAELADALDSGSNSCKAVQVQVLLSAPKNDLFRQVVFLSIAKAMVYHHTVGVYIIAVGTLTFLQTTKTWYCEI